MPCWWQWVPRLTSWPSCDNQASRIKYYFDDKLIFRKHLRFFFALRNRGDDRINICMCVCALTKVHLKL